MRFLIPKSRTGMVVRFFAAAVIVVGSGAATTAVAGLLQVNTLVGYISVNQGISSKQIKLPSPGKPETLLLIGSDHRAGASTRGANTDTMLLMRLNAKSSTINVLSIPRDLQVDVPGEGVEKLNAAYSQGGYSLLIRTIRQDVFPGFYPNHVIDTNFTGFSDLIDAIGCVYSDVDHRYYNDSNSGLPGDDYSSIDIQPGYQKLCGDNQSVSGALPFVRFRHTDTDIVRNARQQDFLRWAKDQYSAAQLLHNRAKLLKIFGKHSTTDKSLHTSKGLIELFDLVVNADGSALKQITFPAILPSADAAVSYVTAEPALEQAAYKAFLAPTKRAKRAKKTSPTVGTAHAKHRARPARIDTAGLTSDPADGRAQAQALTRPGMPVYYPRLIDAQSVYCTPTQPECLNGDEPASVYAHSFPRQYLIPNQHHHKVAAWRMTLVINPLRGQFYGVQGVAWRDPPLLASPSGTKVIDGRKLYLYAGDGGHLTTVAWHRGGDSYWISNDLTSDIPNSEMIGMAASMVRYRP